MSVTNEIGQSMKTLFFTALTETSTSDLEGIGTTRIDQYGNKYRWVYNCGAVASRAGGPACYDATLLAAATFLQHALPDAADADVNFLAGIWMAAVAAASYGWVMTNGIYGTAKMAGAETGTTAGSPSAAVNDILVASTLTTVTGTNTSRAYAFLSQAASIGAAIVGTGAGTAATVTELVRGRVRVLSSGTPVGSVTTTSPVNVLVEGFIR
jgi:hypothetical protein